MRIFNWIRNLINKSTENTNLDKTYYHTTVFGTQLISEGHRVYHPTDSRCDFLAERSADDGKWYVYDTSTATYNEDVDLYESDTAVCEVSSRLHAWREIQSLWEANRPRRSEQLELALDYNEQYSLDL